MTSHSFTFYFYNNSVKLRIWGNYMMIYSGHFPLTFTVQECLEDYCDGQGYCFVQHFMLNSPGLRLQGTFNFKGLVG